MSGSSWRRVAAVAPPLVLRAPRLLAAVCTLVLGAWVAACGGTSGNSDNPSPSKPGETRTSLPPPATSGTTNVGSAPSGPRIVSLDVSPIVECVGPAEVEIDVTYEAVGADRVIFLVDEAQVPGTLPAVGTARVPLECDGNIHVVVATAVAADGTTGVESRAIQTTTEPALE